jgi:hypothetical protein
MTEPEEPAFDEAALVAEIAPPPEARVPAVEPVPAAAVATTPPHPSGFVIPDFAEDKRTIESFEAARERFLRSESQSAEDEILKDFKRRRELLQAEVATAEAVIAERQTKWEKAVGAYAKKISEVSRENQSAAAELHAKTYELRQRGPLLPGHG